MSKKVAVIGMGYVGIPIAALIADTDLFQVTGIQRRSKRSGWKIDFINSGKCPIKNEPELPELIFRVVIDKKSFIVTDDVSILSDMDYILIDVQTPTDENHIPLYLSLREVCDQIGQQISRGTTVIIESTCAPGTTDYIIKPIIEEVSGLECEKGFYLAFAYERVMVGRLIFNILNYKRVIGGIGGKSAEKAAWLYKQVLKSEIIQTTALTAELAKVVENTYRDVNVAFANEVALVAESLGVDIYDVRKLVNSLPFIEGEANPHRNMHVPGAGTGGHCLPKDPWLLKYGLTQYGKKIVHLNVIEASRYRNQYMPKHTIDLLTDCIQETNRVNVKDLKISVLGVAFIQDSDDPRNTPTTDILKYLDEKKLHYLVHDPLVRQEEVDFAFSSNLDETLRESDAIVVVTAHQEYKNLDLKYIKSLMKANPIIVDGRTTFDPKKAIEMGFTFKSIGRGSYGF